MFEVPTNEELEERIYIGLNPDLSLDIDIFGLGLPKKSTKKKKNNEKKKV